MTLAIAEAVLAHACARTGFTPETIRSRMRIASVVRARHVICAVLRKRTEWSYPQIGRFVGLTDHTTVIHACRRLPHLIANHYDALNLHEHLLTVAPIRPGNLQGHLAMLGGAHDIQPIPRIRKRGGAMGNIAAQQAVPPPAPPPPPALDLDQVEAAVLPKPARPAFTVSWPVVIGNGRPARAVVMNAEDMNYSEKKTQKAMIAGSRKLAAAVNALRRESCT